MGIIKSLTTLVSTPIRCLGELGEDLSCLTDDKKDETNGLLSIATLGTSSLVKGVVKSIKKGFSEELRYYGQMYLDRQRQIELAKKSQKSIIEMAKNKGITKEMIISYCSVIQLEDFNKNVLFAAVDSEGEYFFEE